MSSIASPAQGSSISSQLVNSGDDPSKRLKGVTIVKPIIYGNVAKYFGKKRESDGHTHEWKVFIKPYYKEDISRYVKKVSFKLHESYPVNLRILTKPPFEINETGWGEFELVIKIYFHDPNERPVTLYHLLKLFKTKDASCDATNSVLFNEYYEEIIFSEPTILMYNTLNNLTGAEQGSVSTPPSSSPATVNVIATHSVNFEQQKVNTYAQIKEAHEKIQKEIALHKNKLNTARDIINKLKMDMTLGKNEKDIGASL